MGKKQGDRNRAMRQVVSLFNLVLFFYSRVRNTVKCIDISKQCKRPANLRLAYLSGECQTNMVSSHLCLLTISKRCNSLNYNLSMVRTERTFNILVQAPVSKETFLFATLNNCMKMCGKSRIFVYHPPP